MDRTKPTLGEKIDALARLTGASAGFVDKVRALFARKGIGLEARAEPFEEALAHAFERQAEVRRDVENAQRSLGRLRARMAEIDEALGGSARRSAALESGIVVRGEWDQAVVPGPEGVH